MSDLEKIGNLRAIRNRHHDELVSTGIARRFIEAQPPVNYMLKREEITEGTRFFPNRSLLMKMPIAHLVGPSSIAESTSGLPKNLRYWTGLEITAPGSFALGICRLDIRNNGYDVSSGFMGLQLRWVDQPTPQLVPLIGIEADDLLEVSRMIDEVHAQHNDGALPFLNPETLLNDTISVEGPVPLI